ncbi:MAG: alanine:cation symporter family protein, partial [Pseudomonadota bacterium]
MLPHLDKVFETITGPFLIVILLGTGVFLTLRFRFIQIRGFWEGVKITWGKYNDPNHPGDITHFKALCGALSATVGVGNIAGVAAAIALGGPGAIFWMWMTAFLGMAIKLTECTLAQKYREVHEDGSVSGGPMYYIERGLGKKWKPLAIAFSFFA